LVYTTSEEDFLNSLKTCDEAWIVSGHKLNTPINIVEFSKEIDQFSQSGKGLMIMADKFEVFHANLVLSKIPIGTDATTERQMFVKF